MSRATPDVNSAMSSRFIRAGAGAGKTTSLISTFLSFVKEFRSVQKRYPRVVMTTFTRKATQEVKERLLVSAFSAGEKEIFEYINKKSFVHISTIHGLLSIYLSQYAEYLKFPQEIRIIDGPQYNRLLKKQMNELLKRNTVYLEILEHHSFANLVELCKKALDSRAQYPGFTFVSEADLLAVAEEKKAGLIETLQQIFSLVPEEPANWRDFFDHLRRLKAALEQNRDEEFFELADDFPKKPAFLQAKPAFTPLANELIEDFRKNKLKLPFDSAASIAKHQGLNSLFCQFINELFSMMMAGKRSTGEVTISDLENLSLQLIEEFPETAEGFSKAWDYFMVDEYQDTSPLQVRILNALIQDRPCFIVGDPQQSIYLFRGARSEVFEIKAQEMAAKKAEIQFLETNYRSEPPLMNFMNQFFSEFSGQFQPMQTKSESQPQRSLPHEAHYIKTYNQTQAVLFHLKSLIAKGINPQDICVLSRNNKKLIELAQQAGAFSVPVQLQASAGFEEKREILDLIAFNRFLNNPHDNTNLVTLLRSPWLYLADTEILALSQNSEARSTSLWTALLGSAVEIQNVLSGYLDLFDRTGALQTTRQLLEDTGFVAHSELYDQTGKREANIFKFLITLAQAEKTTGFSLGLFLEEQFQTLQSDLGSSNSEAQPVLQPNCVSLMTVHASKGLQFRHVLIIGFSDTPQVTKMLNYAFDEDTQKFSLAVFDEDESKLRVSAWSQLIKERFVQREYAEYERVLYVAMTRAIESLSLFAQIPDPAKTNRTAISDKSWYKKIDWPEEGEHVAEDHSVLSVVYDDSIEKTEKPSGSSVTARKKFATGLLTGSKPDSVTELISKSGEGSGGDSDYKETLKNLKKAQRGTDLHRLFESMKYLKPEALESRLQPADKKMLDFLLVQQKLNMRKILDSGYNEWGFGLKVGSRFIQGQIDLWSELENEVHVLDFKTGSSRYVEKAFEQISVYTRALLEMKQIGAQKKIVLSVIYPHEEKIEQRFFNNATHFNENLSAGIRDIFSVSND